MEADDYRFTLSADKYLERHSVLDYIQDAVTQLLEHREENPKINTTKFFSEYFNSVREGNHVLFREYSYILSTQHNRASFVRMFWRSFKHIGRKGDLLSIGEYHALVCLLCPDFPFQPIQKTGRIILMDDALDCLISFSDFLYAFQTQFCYDEFLSKCAEAYQVLVEAPQSPHTTVIVPTSENASLQLHQTANGGATSSDDTANSSDGVDASQFYRALVPICEKMDLKAPHPEVLKEILLSVKRVTFFGFLMALAKSETLNSRLGKLPEKSELLDVSEQENAAPPMRPSSGKHRPRSAQARPLSASGTTTQAPSGEPSDQSGTQKAARLTKSLAGTTALTLSTTTVITTTTTTTTSAAATATSGSASAPVSTVTASPKSLTERTKPAPRRTRRTVIISDDDDDDDDDDDCEEEEDEEDESDDTN